MNHAVFRDIAKVTMVAALMAVLGLVPKIDLMLGVPITMQTLGVMMAGVLLGPRLGALSVLLFLLAVVLGLPLLSGGRGGLAPFLAPGVGYLLAWPLGAVVTGLLMRRLPTGRAWQAAISAFVSSLVGGLVLVHLFGVVGLHFMLDMPWDKAALATLVFVPGDLIKCALTALMVNTLVGAMPEWPLAGSSAKRSSGRAWV